MAYVLTYQPLTTRIRAARIEKEENLEIRRIPWFGCNWFHKLEPYPLLEFLYLTPALFVYSFFFMVKNRGRIDAIHTNGFNAAFIGKFLAKAFKKRSVMSTCAVYNLSCASLFSKIIKWTLEGYDRILALGEISKKELLSIGLPEGKIQVYSLWVDIDKYVPLDKEKAKRIIGLSGKFFVLYVGRFIRIKGVEELLEAAKIADQNVNFVFIGDDGPCFNLIERAADKFSNIMLIKGIRGRQLVPYYQAADIFVIPSQYQEAFGKVIIEALSCGTPVIGSNRGAIPYIVNPDVGRITEPEAQGIKREIEYLYSHPEVLNQLTRNCRSYAEKFSCEKSAKIITESYYA